MTQIMHARVIDKDGISGTIIEQLDHAGQPTALVRFDDDQQLLVPFSALVLQSDGSYTLALSRADLAQTAINQHQIDGARQTLVLPVIEETLDVQRRTVETGRVRISKLVREREETVDEPLLREHVEIERVTINRVLDAPVEVRREGDTLIIPILEEVLVVEKRLMLKEEVHVRMRRTEAHEPQQVTLRSEEIVVEQLDPQGQPQASGTDRA